MPPQTTHVGTSDRRESDRSRPAEETLFDAAPDGLLVIALNNTIVAVNHQTLKLFGYSREELLGTRVERLLPEGLRESHVRHPTDDAKDLNAHSMEVAIAFLRRDAPHADAPSPDLVILDLNLPRKDGIEVLTEIKDGSIDDFWLNIARLRRS